MLRFYHIRAFWHYLALPHQQSPQQCNVTKTRMHDFKMAYHYFCAFSTTESMTSRERKTTNFREKKSHRNKMLNWTLKFVTETSIKWEKCVLSIIPTLSAACYEIHKQAGTRYRAVSRISIFPGRRQTRILKCDQNVHDIWRTKC